MNAEFAHLRPDVAEIERHLVQITRRWGEVGMPVLLEVVTLTTHEPAKVESVQYFDPTPRGIAQAVKHAASMNVRVLDDGHRLNAYATPNPVDAAKRPPMGARSKKGDIPASFYHWIDGDSAGVAERILTSGVPKATFWVNTGTVPHQRPHLYWELETPARNLPAWSAIQKAIAIKVGGDTGVHESNRTMRLAGTVSWPPARKQEKGYVADLVALHVPPDAADRIVTSERMAAFAAVKPKDPADEPFIDTGDEFARKTAADYAEILRRACTDGEKHGGVRDLAATLAGMGVNRELCEAIVRAACPVWDDGVEKLIESAYAKFYSEQDAARAKAAKQASARYKGLVTAGEFEAARKPPCYVLDGILQLGYVYALTGRTGAGKTAVLLLLAICVARGVLFGNRECRQGSVMFLAGENPDNVRTQFYGLCDYLGLRATDLPIHFHAGSFAIGDSMERLQADAAAIPNLALVVVDTHQSFFTGDDDNHNIEMVEAAKAYRQLCGLPGTPAVAIACHPTKVANRESMVPRGGSAFLNEIDGNAGLWCIDDVVEMYQCGKHRGAPYEPIKIKMLQTEPSGLVDDKGRQMPCTVARVMMDIEIEGAAREAESREDLALAAIRANPIISHQGLADHIGIGKSTAGRLLARLQERKWIRRKGRTWVLTAEGDEVLDG